MLGGDGLPTGENVTVYNGQMWGYEDRGINVLGEFKATDQLALVAGYDYQKYDGRDDVFLIAPTSEEVHAPFAQVKFDAGDLALAAGVRHNMPSDGQSKTVWNVSGRYGGAEGAYVRGQVGTSFRLPDAYELYVVDPCCEQGNPNLVGEESFNVEGGIGFRRGPFSGEIMGFHRTVENLIDITYDLPGYTCEGTDYCGFIVNTDDKVRMWGGEAVASVQLNEVFAATVDYTRTKATLVGDDLQLNNIPRDQAKFILTAEAPTGRFGGGATLNWVGNLYANLGRPRTHQLRRPRGARPVGLGVPRSRPDPAHRPQAGERARCRLRYRPDCGTAGRDQYPLHRRLPRHADDAACHLQRLRLTEVPESARASLPCRAPRPAPPVPDGRCVGRGAPFSGFTVGSGSCSRC